MLIDTYTNIPMAIFLTMLSTLITITSRRMYGLWLNPVSLICTWLGGWLAVAQLNVIGIPAPSFYASSVIAIGIIFIFLGAIFNHTPTTKSLSIYSTQQTSSQLIKYVGVLVILIAPIILWFGYLGLEKQSAVNNLAESRGDILEGVGVYGSVYGYLFYKRIVDPLLFCCILWAQCQGAQVDKKGRIILGVVLILVLAESLGSAGRSLIFFLVIGFLYTWVFKSQNAKNKLSKIDGVKRIGNATPIISDRTGRFGSFVRRQNVAKIKSFGGKKVISLTAIFVGVLLWLNNQRFLASGYNTLEISNYFTIWYHTLGFALFDSELSDSSSRLNTLMTFGMASFGGALEYLFLLLRPLYAHDSVVQMNGIYHNDFVQLGYSGLLNAPIVANAYYTVFYSLYLDFGLLGVIFGCFFYGKYLSQAYCNYIFSGRISYLILLSALLYCGIFGLFQSPLELPRFWIALLFAYWINRLERSNGQVSTIMKNSRHEPIKKKSNYAR